MVTAVAKDRASGGAARFSGLPPTVLAGFAAAVTVELAAVGLAGWLLAARDAGARAALEGSALAASAGGPDGAFELAAAVALLAGLVSLSLLGVILATARRVAREIAERERLSAERAEMVELQRHLMAVVSHDLRTPLTTLKGGASLLARSPGLTETQRDDATRLVSTARRMERLIRDLLDVSRVRAGQDLPLAPGETDLVELCRHAVADLGRDVERRVAVERRGDPMGWWDADRLEQVAANLVTNAVKYGPPNRPVRILVDGEGPEVRLQVKDEGGAIPPEGRQALFEPFRRGRAGDGQARVSAGLGLYIVKRIAEAHGGAVELDSAPERGTVVTVRLPRGRSPSAGPPAAGG